MLIESRPLTDPELAALMTARLRELRDDRAILDGEVFEARDGARYLVGVASGRAVACGALVVLDRLTAQVKRLYVRPAHRRRGIARQLLGALEELAFLGGQEVVRAETGADRHLAVSLYRSAGYAEIPPLGRPGSTSRSVCFEKRLAVRA